MPEKTKRKVQERIPADNKTAIIAAITIASVLLLGTFLIAYLL